MITSISQTYEFRGLSTDDKSKIVKPGNGSVFREIDTGKFYMYNAQSSDWVEFTPGGGSGGASSMSDLEDVSLENLEAGQVLKWDEQEQKWVNADDTAATEIGNLSDVSIDNPTSGQVLKYDATTEKWINGNEVVVIDNLNDLEDVDLTSLADGQMIVYDATSQKWKNADIPQGYDDAAHTIDITNFNPSNPNSATLTFDIDKFIKSNKSISVINIIGNNIEEHISGDEVECKPSSDSTCYIANDMPITFNASMPKVAFERYINFKVTGGTTLYKVIEASNQYTYARYYYRTSHGAYAPDAYYGGWNTVDGHNARYITLQANQSLSLSNATWLESVSDFARPVLNKYEIKFKFITNNKYYSCNIIVYLNNDIWTIQSKTIAEISTIPDAPTTDGTYELQATVTSGSPTYSWETQVTYSGGDGIDITSNVVKIDTTNASANDVLSFSGQNISWISPCTSAEITEIVNGLI